jgi:hypothetical protein
MHEHDRAVGDGNCVVAQVLCRQCLHQPTRGRLEGHALGHGDEAFVRNRHHFGIASRHPFPRDPGADLSGGLVTDRDHHARAFHTQDERQRSRRVHAAAKVAVHEVNAGSLNLDDRLVGLRARNGPLLDAEDLRRPETQCRDDSHCVSSSIW